MTKFEIEVTETLSRIIVVEAETDTAAMQLIKEKYRAQEIVLDYQDFVSAEFEMIE